MNNKFKQLIKESLEENPNDLTEREETIYNIFYNRFEKFTEEFYGDFSSYCGGASTKKAIAKVLNDYMVTSLPNL